MSLLNHRTPLTSSTPGISQW